MLGSVVLTEHIAKVVEAWSYTYRECYSMIDLNGESMLFIHYQLERAREKRGEKKEGDDVGYIGLVQGARMQPS
jgi:hypothetical protein